MRATGCVSSRLFTALVQHHRSIPECAAVLMLSHLRCNVHHRRSMACVLHQCCSCSHRYLMQQPRICFDTLDVLLQLGVRAMMRPSGQLYTLTHWVTSMTTCQVSCASFLTPTFAHPCPNLGQAHATRQTDYQVLQMQYHTALHVGCSFTCKCGRLRNTRAQSAQFSVSCAELTPEQQCEPVST